MKQTLYHRVIGSCRYEQIRLKYLLLMRVNWIFHEMSL